MRRVGSAVGLPTDKSQEEQVQAAATALCYNGGGREERR